MASTTPTPAPVSFAHAFAGLRPHLAALDALLREQVAAFETEIRAMADACIDTSGKRIRPALVFFSGWSGESVSPELVRVAAVIEMVHLATLVHDDIMDEAEVRRARPTASKQFGPEAAVLLGDALFSHALHLAAQFPTTAVCAAVAESTRRVCAGEIMQTLRRGSGSLSREDYFRVIDLKTAELFRVSCHLGALLGGAPGPVVEASAKFGRSLGIGYQIYDDLADFFGTERQIGKTLGTDLESGKLTLPLLELHDRLDVSGRSELLAEITGDRRPDLDRRVAQMHEFGIFTAVEKGLEIELAAAEAALAEFAGLPSTRLLLSLVGALREQVGNLRPS